LIDYIFNSYQLLVILSAAKDLLQSMLRDPSLQLRMTQTEQRRRTMAWSSIRNRSTFALGLALGIAVGRIGYPAAFLTRQ